MVRYIPKTVDLLESCDWLHAVVWNTLPLCARFLFKTSGVWFALKMPWVWSKFKRLLRLPCLGSLVFPLRKAAKHREKPMACLANTACAAVLASHNASAFRAEYCCRLIDWYSTYLIRIIMVHTSDIKYKPLFKTISVFNYWRNVCSNFWSICGNAEWDIMFWQGWSRGFVNMRAFPKDYS